MQNVVEKNPELKPSNIIFSEAFQYLIEEALSTANGCCKESSSRERVREAWSTEASFGDDRGLELQVVNTFICAFHRMHSDITPSAVTKSTTDIVGPNPRSI